MTTTIGSSAPTRAKATDVAASTSRHLQIVTQPPSTAAHSEAQNAHMIALDHWIAVGEQLGIEVSDLNQQTHATA